MGRGNQMRTFEEISDSISSAMEDAKRTILNEAGESVSTAWGSEKWLGRRKRRNVRRRQVWGWQETPNGPTGNTIMTRKPDAWGCNTKPTEPQMASQLRAISTPYKEPRALGRTVPSPLRPDVDLGMASLHAPRKYQMPGTGVSPISLRVPLFRRAAYKYLSEKPSPERQAGKEGICFECGRNFESAHHRRFCVMPIQREIKLGCYRKTNVPLAGCASPIPNNVNIYHRPPTR